MAPYTALLSRAVAPSLWRSFITWVEIEQKVDRDELLGRLVEVGYERVPLIEGKGQCSGRGDIIDVYPFGWQQPLRITLFDDTVESIRLFDLHTQRSTDHLPRAGILPAGEMPLPENIYAQGAARIRADAERVISGLRRSGDSEAANRLKTNIAKHLDQLAGPGGLDILTWYFPYFFGTGASLLDYLTPEFLIFIEDPAEIEEKERALQRELAEHHANLFLQGELLHDQIDYLWKLSDLFARIECPVVECNLFAGDSAGWLAAQYQTEYEVKGVFSYHGQWDLLENDFRSWREKGYRLCILVGSDEHGAGLLKSIREYGLPVSGSPGDPWEESPTAPAQVITAGLEEGFIIPALGLVVLTGQNLVPLRRKRKRLVHKEGIKLRDYRELAVGDYVVHEQHGIGKYLGVNTMEINGVQRITF